ncbi:ABC transporter ATP-binding protein [Methanosarcina sp. 2.H.T.1A.6]|uniref:ABC transporter ATP-binding protein n=1 Tax=unclassified Methanosarcina TaxID=2644672 RepID=UPI0006217970|nr:MULTISPECIES: ABC transporter ATP-binding protein [unclassified Methanosarcina]KKG13894.1 ABC transporter ATP-binding protein [Methanosarcina sp. 2.H.T.1A.3]KKG17818.1 ABC transporter ATP-binding protein [Methanosarcina sp. 2.H.T.1A.15]KKG21654.1 ABC transporter ATP-binding protein [Methanosarcina sp. 2.H.T.1A.8]KKG25085.1 ABC transporter ATP-binding protein [Methanosarcina sp. 2.H.T.1A.6]
MEIEIKNLSKAYGPEKSVLSGINLELRPPSMVGLIGPNGAGKTTLMKILVRQLLASAGSIKIDGMDIGKSENYLKNRLGYLPQEFGLYEELTVYQFLDYMALLKGLGPEKKERIESCIEKTGLSEKQNTRIKTLSGGQKQRVGIAQALLNDPELLIVDEPTVGLDPAERVRFRNLLAENANHRLVLLSTHIIEDVESICNRLIVLNRGEILFDGNPVELIKKAAGHVGILESGCEAGQDIEKDCIVTSRLITETGAQYRVVGDKLPSGIKPMTPSLEDAYMYLITQNG